LRGLRCFASGDAVEPHLCRICRRHFEVNRSAVYLIDTRKPYVARSLEPVDRTIVRIPRDVLERRLRMTSDVTNRPIPLKGDAALLAGFVGETTCIGPLSPTAPRSSASISSI